LFRAGNAHRKSPIITAPKLWRGERAGITATGYATVSVSRETF
jgi:hypothetical protein